MPKGQLPVFGALALTKGIPKRATNGFIALRTHCAGRNACEAARSQRGIEYLGNAIPRLPLAQCVRADCECDYLPVGSKKLRSLYVDKPLPPNDGSFPPKLEE